MLIEKDYFTLEEVLEHWQIPRRDAVYLAENGKLRLSVRVFHLRCELGIFEEDGDIGRFRIPCSHKAISGLVDLKERDVHALFRDGSVSVDSFYTPPDEYLDIHPDAEALVVRESDLLIRQKSASGSRQNCSRSLSERRQWLPVSATRMTTVM